MLWNFYDTAVCDGWHFPPRMAAWCQHSLSPQAATLKFHIKKLRRISPLGVVGPNKPDSHVHVREPETQRTTKQSKNNICGYSFVCLSVGGFSEPNHIQASCWEKESHDKWYKLIIATHDHCSLLIHYDSALCPKVYGLWSRVLNHLQTCLQTYHRLLPSSDPLPGSTPWPAEAGHWWPPFSAFPPEPLWLQPRWYDPTYVSRNEQTSVGRAAQCSWSYFYQCRDTRFHNSLSDKGWHL